MKALTRRTFIEKSGKGLCLAPWIGSGLVDPLIGAAQGAVAFPEGQEPLFRFLQINDMHVQCDTIRYNPNKEIRVGSPYVGANARASWLLESLRQHSFAHQSDFILSIGDMINGKNLEAIKYDMDYFQRHFLSQYPLPFYPAMGNHENSNGEGNPVLEGPYREVFGKDRINYSFIHKGIHVIVLNNSGTAYLKDPAIASYRLTCLKNMLSEHPELPKIVCCHVPLIPIRERTVLAESFGWKSYYTKETEVVQLINSHKDKVLAVLSGHLHITGVVCLDSIYHIVLSGLASYPHDFGLYTVYKDRIDVEVTRVPSDMLMPETNIHGAKRFGKDFTDPQHLDYTSYIMGNVSERRFSIPLNKLVVKR